MSMKTLVHECSKEFFAIAEKQDQEKVHQQKWVNTWWYAHAREQDPTMKKEEAIDKHNMKACQNNYAE